MRKIFLALLCLTFASAAYAATPKPPEVGAVIHAGAPIGEGTYRKMMLNVYDASLWTDAPSWSMSAPFALSLHYRMDISKNDIAERSVQEMSRAGTISRDMLDHYRGELDHALRDVKDGDRITAIYDPASEKLSFYYNGNFTYSVTDKAFSWSFIGIWLSPRTSEPEFRKQLLGEAKE
jgi:hypothetical protein